MKTRKCETCGKKYEPTGNTQRFCAGCGKARRKESKRKRRQTPEYKESKRKRRQTLKAQQIRDEMIALENYLEKNS